MTTGPKGFKERPCKRLISAKPGAKRPNLEPSEIQKTHAPGLTILIFLLISLLLGPWVWCSGFLRALTGIPVCNLLKRNLYGNLRFWCSCVGWASPWGEHAKRLPERTGYVCKLKRGLTEKSGWIPEAATSYNFRHTYLHLCAIYLASLGLLTSVLADVSSSQGHSVSSVECKSTWGYNSTIWTSLWTH